MAKSKDTANIDKGNNTEAPTTAEELTVDKEQIKRLPIYDDQPLKINMTFYIDDINSISDVDMDFRVDFYYQQNWVTKGADCLAYKNSLKGRHMIIENVTQTNRLIVTKDYFNLFWLPDIMIANAKEVKQQNELIETILLSIYFEGDDNGICRMEHMARYYSIVSCPMDFRDAPVDSQLCTIQLRSFAFNKKNIELNWAENVEFNPDLRLLEHDYKIGQEVTNTTLFNETYSVLKINIKFQRNIANKLVGVYTPSILIVVITFCSFWLGLNSTSERVAIGITALLALVTQFNDVRQSLPATSYTTEIDKWMILCMVFVSVQLIQCTVVDYVYHSAQNKHKLRQITENSIQKFKSLRKSSQQNSLSKLNSNTLCPNLKTNNNNNNNLQIIRNAFEKRPSFKVTSTWCPTLASWWSKLLEVPVRPDTPEYIPSRIDAYSRIFFPLSFSIMCLFYWPTMITKVF